MRRIELILFCLLSMLALSGCAKGEKVSRLVVKQVRINEVMSTNHYYAQLPDGSCCDWLELYNYSDETVNLEGCMLSDNVKDPDRWKVPAELKLAPKTYCLIYLSGLDQVDENGNIHTNFKLSSKGETLVFSNAWGDVVQQLEIPACELSNISYGYDSGNSVYGWFAQPSPGAQNAGNTAADADALMTPGSDIVINEYMSKNTYVLYDSNNQYSDWIELYNASDQEVSLYGFSLSDSDSAKGKWFFPQEAVIPPKSYLVIFCTDQLSEKPGEYHADFRLREGDTITLYSVTGTVVDSVKVSALNPNVSCGRDPDSGEFRLFAVPTPGRANTTYSYALTSAVDAAPAAPVFVSEAMCVSDDESDDKYDFIEIHNASDKAVSLKGYGLSKSREGPAFAFPDIRIAAHGYQVVYCTGRNVSRQDKMMEAAFKLNQGGEEIFFFDSENHIIDILPTGKQTAGHSSGRLDAHPNGTYVFESPTPGKSNEKVSAYRGYAPAPVFSSDGGYVSSGFTLRIEAEEGCTVYYTTDGNIPTAKAAVYDGPITIEQSTVVCAVAGKKDCLMSQTVFASFLVEEEHTIPVVSVSSPPDGLFSEKTGIMSSARNCLVKGEPNYKSNAKRAVTFEYFIDGQKAVSFQAAIRLFGGGSRTFAQKAFAVLMGETYGGNECCFPFFGEYSPDRMEALLLRPSGQDWLRAHIRDEFCSRIIRGSTIQCDYQETQPVALYINGAYWGLYYIREKLNEDYLVNKYGYTKGQIDIIKAEGNVQSGSSEDWEELMAFCDSHNLSVESHYRYICSKVDIDSLIDWWIFETYVANDDTGNVRCYRERNDGKWRWMLFDLDDAFHLSYYRLNYISRYAMGPTHGYDVLPDHDPYKGSRNKLMRNLLRNSEFKKKFITAYCRHIKTTFAPERILPLFEELNTEIQPEMARQYERWEKPSPRFYEYNVQIIRDIINQKPEMAKKQIQEAFGLTNQQMQAYYDNA